jgi:fructose/tagatose bisphosphate aldolase
MDLILSKDTDGLYQDSLSIKNQELQINNEDRLRVSTIDKLISNAIFNKDEKIQKLSNWVIRETARLLGIFPSSIFELYKSIGQGECSGFSVPAINLRMNTYDSARAVIRAAKAENVGAFIFEIARSEMSYTYQTPMEYTSAVLAAAIKEGFKGPLFLQGDHFQVKKKVFEQREQEEVNSLKSLINNAIDAGFYNIDIDSSTIVDLSKPTIDLQQKLNYSVAATLTEYIRKNQPSGITVTVGGEIGEVGLRNSTAEDLRGYMEGYLKKINGKNKIEGISKISVQTGTSHGGVVLPDGSMADVNIDFGVMEMLSKLAREEYGLAGAVQHGASTLPENAFHKFPEVGCAEIHLATGFQNLIYDNKYFPADLRKEIFDYVKKEFSNEWKKDFTEEQFIYKTRKKALGPFKEKLWSIDEDIMTNIGKELETKFVFLFNELKVKNTDRLVNSKIKNVVTSLPKDYVMKREYEKAADFSITDD